MSNADKTTIKVRAYSGDGNNVAPRNNLTEDQNNMLELAKKNAQLEDEKKKSLEYLKTIEQLRESLKLEQAKMAEMVKRTAELEAKLKGTFGLETKTREFAELEAKVKELTEVLGKISGITATGKVN